MKIEALEFSKVQFFTLADGKHGAIPDLTASYPWGSSAASSSARANTLQFLSRGNARRSWFRVDGRQPGHYTRFGVTSGWPVIRPQLARTAGITRESVSMSGLAICTRQEA